MSDIILVEKAGAVARVTFNRPERRNALSADSIARLGAIAAELREDSGIRIVILSGGAVCFSAGADRKDERLFGDGMATAEQLRIAEIGTAVVSAWETLPQVTIAAIERHVVGGALTFAMACDFRVMGRDAFASVPEVALGFNYGLGSVPRLLRLVGLARTRRIVMLAERVPAAQALEWGLIDYIAEEGGVDAFSAGLAERLLAMPGLALEMTKRGVNAAAGVGQEPTAHADMASILLCLAAARGGASA